MIFIDTGPLLARYVAQDSLHRKALSLWKDLGGETLLTSHHVLDETITLLSRRTSYAFAAERAENIYSSRILNILHSTREDESAAVRMLRKYADQRVSFTDCISFVLMRRERVQTAFTFDRHFSLAGFRCLGQP